MSHNSVKHKNNHLKHEKRVKITKQMEKKAGMNKVEED